MAEIYLGENLIAKSGGGDYTRITLSNDTVYRSFPSVGTYNIGTASYTTSDGLSGSSTIYITLNLNGSISVDGLWPRPSKEDSTVRTYHYTYKLNDTFIGTVILNVTRYYYGNMSNDKGILKKNFSSGTHTFSI